MNNMLKLTLVGACLLPSVMSAQDVDRTKYPDFSATVNPDWSLMKPIRKAGAKAETKRPDHYNNADTPYFPPVFNQAGGSCGSASRICYMFTHELNSFRGTNGKDPHHYYPSHFVWLLTNGNSGKDAFVQFVGVPSAATYGGQTYSSLFGYQDTSDNDFGWMTGYEKWYEAMFNRMLKPSNFPISVETEEGREAVKNWLWNHNGDTDFHSGGIVGIGVASGGKWMDIPSTPTNDAIGVTKKSYVRAWGSQVDHALTIVGYDDRIEFDIDGNGVFGEKDKDEVGAWIVVNSWGNWENDGFIYCPYAYAGPSFSSFSAKRPNGFWQPEIYRVRKNYVPKRTIKIKMDYSRRSEIYLSAGVSSDLNATEPEASQAFDHFKYAGDGANGNTNPAPEIPMLGRWADGKLHTEPMEFGYDLTDLSANYDINKPLKYFFMIDTRSWGKGEGHIYNASIIDYVQDALGVETPFQIADGSLKIESKGKRTVISVIVQGMGVYGPENLSISDGKLHWTAPSVGASKVTGYKIYQGSKEIATLGATANSYDLTSDEAVVYGVTALFGDKESGKATVAAPAKNTENMVTNFKHSGFSIPDVFGSKYNEATIEYWIRPNSLANWNQSAGPGWGSFMFHANADGTLTAGWDTSNRLNVSGALVKNTWRHVAIVVKNNRLTIFVNGAQKATTTSSNYKGLGGFGDLVFSNGSGNNSYQDAQYDEIRIWKTARTAKQIKDNYRIEMGDGSLPAELLAYFKGDLINVDGQPMLRDHTTGQHHATLLDEKYENIVSEQPKFQRPTAMSVSINEPTAEVYAGEPVTFSATASSNVQKLTWSAESAGVKSTQAVSPTFTFPKEGEHKVSVVATGNEDATESAEITVKVLPAKAPDATFTATSLNVPAGHRITFLAANPQIGYTYKWELPGAELSEGTNANIATSYNNVGTYTARLTVTTNTGQTATSEQKVVVTNVAPQADFKMENSVAIVGEPIILQDASKFQPSSWLWNISNDQNAVVGKTAQFGFIAEHPGVYNVTLHAGNVAGQNSKTIERGLTICNADGQTGLNFGYDAARVTLTKVPFEANCNAFTIAWWMRAGQLTSMGNAMGDSNETFQMYTNASGAMVVNIAGKTFTSKNGYVVAGEWHNYAVVLGSGKLSFYRDAVQHSTAVVGATLKVPAMSKFVIGADEAPVNALIDELSIWNKVISAADMKKTFNAPIENVTEAEGKGLVAYYQFNQNSGDVKDATSKNNTGVRTGFGPDGDAWVNSRGIFCLNFADKTSDVSGRLQNRKEPFSYEDTEINPTVGKRYFAIKDWTIENAMTEGEITTGCHVDSRLSYDMTFTTSENGFAAELKDHKVYQTITLPAGTYALKANYGNNAGFGAGSYLVVAAGAGIPNSADLATSTIAYKAMADKSNEVTSNSVIFSLAEEQEISVGLLVNLGMNTTLTIKGFELTRFPNSDVKIPDGIGSVLAPEAEGQKAIYDMWGRRVSNTQKGGIYVIDGNKVIVR